MIVQFEDKKDCCGCAACFNICPTKAITMESDEDGFIFPRINKDLCIKCKKCINVCAFQNTPVIKGKPIATYVAINKDANILFNSASGGVFGALASLVFEKGGVVFGCAYNIDMEPYHICVESQTNIKKVQGSKYVQSYIGDTFLEVKQFLKKGKWVLYTGTPCQIAGLKSYLGREYDKLITADIVCHGVPGADLFVSYIRNLEKKLKGKIVDFKFRDKSEGWGKTGKIVFKKNECLIEKKIIPNISSYYSYFLESDICRESCYTCKYACSSREGDFTMGDYWGIKNAHPHIDPKKGVSILLINSRKGMNLKEDLRKYLYLTESTFEFAREENMQLNRPTNKSTKRESILKMWREDGYKAIEDKFYKTNKKNIRMTKIKMLIPQPIKNCIKNILKRS